MRQLGKCVVTRNQGVTQNAGYTGHRWSKRGCLVSEYLAHVDTLAQQFSAVYHTITITTTVAGRDGVGGLDTLHQDQAWGVLARGSCRATLWHQEIMGHWHPDTLVRP